MPGNGPIFAAILLGIIFFPLRAPAQISPSCEALYESAPVITEIEVDRGPVFTEDDPLPDWLPSETVNRIHGLSREHLITQELLFATGEPLDRYRIEETLRNLRGLGILRSEEIRCETLADNRARVTVATRDAWSLEPILNLAVLDAGTTWTVGLREFNLLGTGKQIRASYTDHLGDRQVGGAYLDPRIMGTRWRWSVAGLDFGGGESATFDVAYPFYSLETRWGGGIRLSHLRGDEAVVRDGFIVNEYRGRRRNLRLDLAHAVVAGTPVTHRVGLFYRYEDRRFDDAGAFLSFPPEDRAEAPLGLTYRRLGDRYITERRIRHFDRPEYFNLANDLSAEAGYSSTAFGADRDEWFFSVRDGQGVAFGEGRFLLGFLSASGRLRSGQVENFEGRLGLDGFLRNTGLDGAGLFHTLFGAVDLLATERLDPDRFLSLGESTGLRGYNDHAITGDRRLRLTFEDRVFAARRVAGLIALGGVVFVDTGYVWEESEGFDLGDLATGVGAGLRIAWPASSTEQVLRIDIAWPLNNVPGDDGKPKIMFVTATEF